MEINAAVFCDAANVSKEGKVNILGIFSTITSNSFPASHAHMAFVVLIGGHRSEIGKHNIRINFIDEDGKEVLSPFTSTFEITQENHETNFILNMNNVKLGQAGNYAADVVIDNIVSKSVSLKVLETQLI